MQLLILGFALTTVVGGALGYFFQRRAWSNQFEVTRFNVERDSAVTALHELCGILDKRRYRMLLVFWFLDDQDSEEFERRVDGYRAVLEEWNDGLNRRLALVATHFGGDLKKELDGLYEDYRRAGRLLDAAIRARRAGAPPENVAELSALLKELNLRNYSFAEAGLSLIVAGAIGSRISERQAGWTPTPPPSDVE